MANNERSSVFVKQTDLLLNNTAQKMKFSIKDFFSKCQEFTEEILDEKLHFFVQCKRFATATKEIGSKTHFYLNFAMKIPK